MRIKILILMFVCLLVYFCSPSNCEDDMSDVKRKHGQPEEINSYSSEGYYSQDWWYWSKGINYTFTWGSLVKEGCEISTYTFTPIPVDATDEEKADVKSTRAGK